MGVWNSRHCDTHTHSCKSDLMAQSLSVVQSSVIFPGFHDPPSPVPSPILLRSSVVRQWPVFVFVYLLSPPRPSSMLLFVLVSFYSYLCSCYQSRVTPFFILFFLHPISYFLFSFLSHHLLSSLISSFLTPIPSYLSSFPFPSFFSTSYLLSPPYPCPPNTPHTYPLPSISSHSYSHSPITQ